MNEKSIETRAHVATVSADGVCRVVTKPGSAVNLDDAMASVEAVEKLLGGKIAPLLVNLTGIKSMSLEARNYFAGENLKRVSTANALLIQSAISKVIGNFFMGLNKPVTPTKLFTNEKEALKWLGQFKTQSE